MNRNDAYTIRKGMADNFEIIGEFVASAAGTGTYKSDIEEIADDCMTLIHFLASSMGGVNDFWTEDGIEDLLEARVEYNSIIDELAENFADIIRCLKVYLPD